MITFSLVQIFSSIVALISALLWFTWGHRHPSCRRFAVGPLTYSLHVVIYYTAWFTPFTHELMYGHFGDWSAGVRLHGLIVLVLFYMMIRLKTHCLNWMRP